MSEPTCLQRDAASVIFNLPKYHVIDAPSHHNRGGSDSDPDLILTAFLVGRRPSRRGNATNSQDNADSPAEAR